MIKLDAHRPFAHPSVGTPSVLSATILLALVDKLAMNRQYIAFA